MRLLAFFAFAMLLRADERTQKLLDGLAKASESFERVAPQVMGVETLHQRALLPPPRFKVRVGRAAEVPPSPVWKQREIVSEYGFAVFGGGALQEVRQVIAVNGKKVVDEQKAEAELAQLVTGNDEQRKRHTLEQLQKYGLQGAATDFGQILLLFSRYSAERYEITYSGVRMVNLMRVQTFHYKQLDGPEALSLFGQGRGAATQHLTVEGEIWARDTDNVPLRITMVATDPSTDQALREEAIVDYAPSEFGSILPRETTHRELRIGTVVMENKFTYAEFRKFANSK